MTSEELLRWRKGHNFSQQEAAELIGCGRRSWQQWEQGDNAIPRYIELALREVDRVLREQ